MGDVRLGQIEHAVVAEVGKHLALDEQPAVPAGWKPAAGTFWIARERQENCMGRLCDCSGTLSTSKKAERKCGIAVRGAARAGRGNCKGLAEQEINKYCWSREAVHYALHDGALQLFGEVQARAQAAAVALSERCPRPPGSGSRNVIILTVIGL